MEGSGSLVWVQEAIVNAIKAVDRRGEGLAVVGEMHSAAGKRALNRIVGEATMANATSPVAGPSGERG